MASISSMLTPGFAPVSGSDTGVRAAAVAVAPLAGEEERLAPYAFSPRRRKTICSSSQASQSRSSTTIVK